jgi:hypothetical protein
MEARRKPSSQMVESEEKTTAKSGCFILYFQKNNGAPEIGLFLFTNNLFF